MLKRLLLDLLLMGNAYIALSLWKTAGNRPCAYIALVCSLGAVIDLGRQLRKLI